MANKFSFRLCKYAVIITMFIVLLNQVSLMNLDWTSFTDENDEVVVVENEIDLAKQNNPVPVHRTKILEYDDNLELITKMTNAETNESITCNPNKYKYISILLNDLKAFNLRNIGRLKTSKEIDIAFEEKDTIRWFWARRARIQIIDGQMYTNNMVIGKDDEEGYRTGIILYLQRIFKLYGAYIPDTDFLWHYHDRKGSMFDLTEYDWKNLSTVPIFVSDFNEASLTNTRTLYFVPRGYLKYKYFADIAESQGGEGKSDLYGSKNVRRIKDYLEFLQVGASKPELLNWRNKTINKAVFRGYLNNGFSRKHLFAVLNLSDFTQVADAYFDAKITTEWANTAKLHLKENYSESNNFYKKKAKEFEALAGNKLTVEQQLAYKYQVNVDGYGVRDNLLYQLLSGSIVLKQLSTLIEFWYFDLMDNEHVIYWENILDLISTVIKLVDSIETEHRWESGTLSGVNKWMQKNWEYLVAHNLTKYNDERLRQITENAKEFVYDYLSQDNMDCFFVHMLQIYNFYFFDTSSLPKEPHSRLKKIPM